MKELVEKYASLALSFIVRALIYTLKAMLVVTAIGIVVYSFMGCLVLFLECLHGNQPTSEMVSSPFILCAMIGIIYAFFEFKDNKEVKKD